MMKKVVSLLIICLIVLTACGSHELSWQEQYDLGIRYLNEGNYAEAIIAFTAAIEIDEKNIDAYLARAEAYIGIDDIDAALDDYIAVTEIDDDCEEAFAGMANIYIDTGEYKKAAKALKEVSDKEVKAEISAKLKNKRKEASDDNSETGKPIKGEPVKGGSVKVDVVDAVNCSRPVNPPAYAGMTSSDFRPQTAIIPMITTKTKAATAFNDKIMGDYKKFADAIASGENLNSMCEADSSLEADGCLAHITYDYSVYNGVVAIMVEFKYGLFASSYDDMYDAYYFDANQDRELTFEEYLDAINIDSNKMTALVNNELANEGGGVTEPPLGGINSERGIEMAYISEDKFVVMFDRVMEMGGPSLMQIDCDIESIQIQE